ncbi:hypothetical protein [Nocardioides aquiterrae]|uniref:STAS domain-containing protein n=1 Tax=Nocardioides aquiterrae TaxID=203799 RepID=A0ABN1UB91_9ACTN
MVSVSFNARERRLVLDGTCWPTDAEGVSDAIRAAADPSRGLVLDLTRLTSLPHEVAAATTAACCAAEADGCRIRVWTLPGSATELALAAASRGEAALAPTS